MDKSTAALLGTVIGGLITIIVAYINGRNGLAAKQIEFNLREKELASAKKSDFIKEKIIKYSKFSGSFAVVSGFWGDIIDIYKQKRDLADRDKNIGAIIDHPHYEGAIQNLNQEKAWISIVTSSDKTINSLKQFEEKFDEFMTELSHYKGKDTSDTSIKVFETKFKNVEKSHRDLIKSFQDEIRECI